MKPSTNNSATHSATNSTASLSSTSHVAQQHEKMASIVNGETKPVASPDIADEEYSFANHGPMHVHPSYLKQGFIYAMPTDRPGEIERYMNIGYEIVKEIEEEAVKTAAHLKPNQSHPLGAAVTVKSGCGATHILMRIPEDLYKKYELWKQKTLAKRTPAVDDRSGIPPEFRKHMYNHLQNQNRVINR